MSTIIQFIHSGKEHSEKSGKNWNIGKHLRKYMLINGEYISESNSTPQKENIFFWGEWEAQSYLINDIQTDTKSFPKYIFKPYYKTTNEGVNTDPFIFGNQFYYRLCRQLTSPSLRSLVCGDIILFGSCLNKQFVLDTVFVVKNYIDYNSSNFSIFTKITNDVFLDVSFERAITPKADDNCNKKKHACNEKGENYKGKTDFKLRMYEAVMYQDKDKFNGMFSYAPCMQHTGNIQGFSRPVIKLPGIISQTLSQNFKKTNQSDIKPIWDSITGQVLCMGLSLMVNNELPPKILT